MIKSSSYEVSRSRRGTAAVSSIGIAIVTLLASATGCSCPPAYQRDVASPGGAFVAVSYSLECGPVAPFNWHVGIKRAADVSFHEIVAIRDAPFETELRWQATNKLQVTFECPSDPAAACAPPTERNWSVSSMSQWEDVTVTYAVGPRLGALLNAETRGKLPR